MKIPDSINFVTESPAKRVPTRDEQREAQFGDFKTLIDGDSLYILSNEGLLAVLQKDIMRIVVPTSLQGMKLDWEHGSRAIGH